MKNKLTKKEKEFKEKVLKEAIVCPLCGKKELLFIEKSRYNKNISYLHCLNCRHTLVFNETTNQIEDLGREKVYKRNNLFFKLLYALNKK